jgi:exodeoxyribonuclease-3
MKIATFNINNINKRLPNLLAWLAEAAPDIACLQELKAEDGDFPEAAIRAAGYGAVWRGQRSWNGVAILAKGADPVLTRDELPGDRTDTQSRYIEAAVRGILVTSIYLPNGNPQPGPKFEYKFAWFERLITHAAELQKSGVPVVLAGDYNVVPTPSDIYRSKSWSKNALVQPQPRAAYARLLAQAGPMRCARCIPTSRCTLSVITSSGAGSAIRDCESIISCSASRSRRVCLRLASTSMSAARRMPAITRPPGSC